ncbi:MAG: hypothetical protein LUG27_06165 [Clostridiales bacterium]|nr:hypothetical protein [Clostridiales bacterium]
MLRIFIKKNGAVSVFLTIILVPVLVVCFLFVDVSRTKLAQGVVNSAGDLTLNTVLTQYDSTLNDYYGLLASCQDIDTFLATADEYFQACLISQGVDAAEARSYSAMINGLLTGDASEISDLLQITESESSSFTVSAVDNGTLENPALMKKEIVEFMRYRAPIEGVSEILGLFQDSASDLENSSDTADLVDKKQDYYEAESDLEEQALDAYQKLKEYVNLNISKDEIDSLKQTLESLESTYRTLHIKMVKDLYNTQNLNIYSAVDLNLDYVAPESSVSTTQIDIYIQNAADSLYRFMNARQALENLYSTLPVYQTGIVYDIQFWVACDAILKQTTAYSDYVTAAQNMCTSMANLKTAMSLLSEEEKNELYLLEEYTNVDAGGEATRQEHYDTLFLQYENLKQTDLNNASSPYNEITSNLSRISETYIGATSTADVDAQIQSICSDLSSLYEKYDDAYEKVASAVNELKKLKKEVQICQNKLKIWSNAADSYARTISMAKDDQTEISEIEQNLLTDLSEENIQELIDRLNNIKSLLGSVKSGIDEYQYNGTKLRSIKNYAQMKKKSGVDETKISYRVADLNDYAEQSFSFTSSSTLQNVSVTDQNNPAVAEVNTPTVYTYLINQFSSYSESGTDEQKEKYQSEKDDYENALEHVDEGSSSVSSAEIKDQESLPSSSYATAQSEGLVSTDAGKISKVVSGLFSDFSKTVSQSLLNLRDDLYGMEYIMSMFSYDTYEAEAKYQLSGSDATLENYETKYASVQSQWESTDLTVTVNKTLTNKMISTENNYSFGNEVEYILYGGTNEENKSSAYSTIFAIRFALNLSPEFSRYWTASSEYPDSIALEAAADAVEAGSCGIIPAPLFKMVVILGLTALESAQDLNYLKNGMPVDLVKEAENLEISYPSKSTDSAGTRNLSSTAFFYSDYLRLILFLKLSMGDEYAVYARTADVIQANMNYKISSDSGFSMNRAIVYFSGTVTVEVKPLMLKLPLASGYTGSISSNSVLNTITYQAIRGY